MPANFPKGLFTSEADKCFQYSKKLKKERNIWQKDVVYCVQTPRAAGKM
jgi:hypothetical protein